MTQHDRPTRDLFEERERITAIIATTFKDCASARSDGVAVRTVEGGDRWLPIDLAVVTGDAELFAGILHSRDDWVRITEERAAMGYSGTFDIAATHSTPEIIQILADYGFDPNADGGSGVPPVFGTISRWGGTGNLVAMIGVGADVRLSARNGSTPLEIAVAFGVLEAVRVLLEAGALDRKVASEQGRLVELADSLGHLEIAALIRGTVPN